MQILLNLFHPCKHNYLRFIISMSSFYHVVCPCVYGLIVYIFGLKSIRLYLKIWTRQKFNFQDIDSLDTQLKHILFIKSYNRFWAFPTIILISVFHKKKTYILDIIFADIWHFWKYTNWVTKYPKISEYMLGIAQSLL